MRNRSLALLPALALAALLSACSDSTLTIAASGPSPLGVAPFVGIQPSTLSAQLVDNAFCPSIPPFLAPLNLIVTVDGDVDLSLVEVRFSFLDQFNVLSPPITILQPTLIAQFGSTRIPARQSRQFPLTFRFGCGSSRAGTILILVKIADQRGTVRSTDLSVAVR